ncbi:MAG TPA: hypothetical protein VGB45_03130 [Abditibacterium sp.]|jgi:hypothetical protein
MKLPFSSHLVSDQFCERMAERERRYPVYTAVDVAIYWLICGALFLFCAALAGMILMQNSPYFAARAAWLAQQVMGLI